MITLVAHKKLEGVDLAVASQWSRFAAVYELRVVRGTQKCLPNIDMKIWELYNKIVGAFWEKYSVNLVHKLESLGS